MIVGYDKNKKELNLGDICKFSINDKQYEGIIDYDKQFFCYTFEMLDNNFPSVFMRIVDENSIEKIINIKDTNNTIYCSYNEII